METGWVGWGSEMMMGVAREGCLLRWACFLVADNAGVVREGHLKKGQVGGSYPHCC